MTQKEDKKIKLANKNSVRFPTPEKHGNILLIGNFDGVCGTLQPCEKGKKYTLIEYSDAVKHNIPIIMNTLLKKKHIYLISTKECDLYFRRLITHFIDKGIFDKVGRNRVIKQYHWQELDCNKTDSEMTDCLNNKLYNGLNKMKFDIVIQNPPYNGNLHLDFFEKGLDVLTETGKMVIIEPATWLIDVRKYGKRGENYKVNSPQVLQYERIKNKINGHVESVVIENLNPEFNVENDSPFAITTIDMSKTFDTIDYTCCGEHKVVNSIYDCNLVGDYKIIYSIIDKISHYDVMRNHTTVIQKEGDFWYAKYTKCGRCSCKSGGRFHLESYYKSNHFKYYYYMGCDDRDEIANTILKKRDDGNKLTDNNSQCVYGSKEEINNWENFIFKNKLSLFLILTLTYDQSNHVLNFLPWLVDKQYTDDEINKLFGFTDEEIKLIDTTIKKYERNSPWFKRYMCGKDAVTDEEVNNFIAEISK